MMMQISFRDVENLSAHLDGQLPQAEKTRLESRLKTDPELTRVLEELRQARAILRGTPQRRVPRTFTLTAKMARIKPPVPRAVPAFSWASAVAMLFFVCTLGTNLIGKFSFGAAAPMMVAAPMGIGGGPAAEGMTSTPESNTLIAPEATTAPDTRTIQPQDTQQGKSRQPINPWLVIWPGLAVVLVGSALLVRWSSIRAFRRRTDR